MLNHCAKQGGLFLDAHQDYFVSVVKRKLGQKAGRDAFQKVESAFVAVAERAARNVENSCACTPYTGRDYDSYLQIPVVLDKR